MMLSDQREKRHEPCATNLRELGVMEAEAEGGLVETLMEVEMSRMQVEASGLMTTIVTAEGVTRTGVELILFYFKFTICRSLLTIYPIK